MKPLNFNRIQINWLISKMEEGIARSDLLHKEYTEQGEHTHAIEVHNYKAEIKRNLDALNDLKDKGRKLRAEIEYLREDLREAMEFNDSEEARAACLERIALLPKREPYTLNVDSNTAKFILKIVEKDLKDFQERVIPMYESASEEEFKDPIQTKKYWINKAKASRKTLDNLKKSLEEIAYDDKETA